MANKFSNVHFLPVDAHTLIQGMVVLEHLMWPMVSLPEKLKGWNECVVCLLANKHGIYVKVR